MQLFLQQRREAAGTTPEADETHLLGRFCLFFVRLFRVGFGRILLCKANMVMQHQQQGLKLSEETVNCFKDKHHRTQTLRKPNHPDQASPWETLLTISLLLQAALSIPASLPPPPPHLTCAASFR